MIFGLTAAHNFIGGGGLSSSDLSGNGKNIIFTDIDWVEGEGVRIDSSGEYGVIDNSDQSLVNSDSGTIIVKLTSLVAFEDAQNHRIIGGSGVSGYFYISKNNSNYLYFIFNDGVTSHYVYVTVGNVPNWQTGARISFQWNKAENIYDSKKMAINIDGTYIVPDGSGDADTLVSYDLATEFSVFNHHSDMGRYLNAIVEDFYTFNRVLSQEELLNIYNNPDSIYTTTSTVSQVGVGIGCGI